MSDLRIAAVQHDIVWNRPEANAEALRGGWLHTGDIAEIRANHL